MAYWTTTGTGYPASGLTIINNITFSNTCDWPVFAEQWAYNSQNYHRGPLPLKCPRTWDGEIELPDGAKLICQNGNYRIETKDQKVNRAFNRYVNASDLLEEFLAFLGQLGIRQNQVLDIPLEVFINWLVMRAAQQDQEEVPVGVKVQDHPKLALITNRARWSIRCQACGRFLSKKLARLNFCSPEHAMLAFGRT